MLEFKLGEANVTTEHFVNGMLRKYVQFESFEADGCVVAINASTVKGGLMVR